LSHLAQPRQFVPGDVLFTDSASPKHGLVIITAGQVQRMFSNARGSKHGHAAAGRLGPGEIFSQFDAVAGAAPRGFFQRLRDSSAGRARISEIGIDPKQNGKAARGRRREGSFEGLQVVDGPLEALILDEPGLVAALQSVPELKEVLETISRERINEAGW
jgi:hypothetical protein